MFTQEWVAPPPHDLAHDFDVEETLETHFRNTSPKFKNTNEIYLTSLCMRPH